MSDKQCPGCGQVKSIASFYARHKLCKQCTSEQRKEAYRLNPEPAKTRALDYHKRHPEKSRPWENIDPEKAKAAKMKWARENKDKQRVYTVRAARKAVDGLTPAYVAKAMGIRLVDLNENLYQLKREQLEVFRLARLLKERAK